MINLVKKCMDSSIFVHLCDNVKIKPVLCKKKFVQGRCRKSCGICVSDEPEDNDAKEPETATTTSDISNKRNIGKL